MEPGNNTFEDGRSSDLRDGADETDLESFRFKRARFVLGRFLGYGRLTPCGTNRGECQ
jgi:hypothetical protein